MFRNPLTFLRPAAMALFLALLPAIPAACTPVASTPEGQASPGPSGMATSALTPTLAANAVTTTAPLTATRTAALPPGILPPTLAEIGVTAPTTDTFDSVAVIPVTSTLDQPLWVAFTTGLRGYDPGGPHVVAVLNRPGDAWHVIDRMELGADTADTAATPDPDGYYGPDYLGPESVAVATIEPTHLWLTIDGGVGAHGGSFGVLSFDGAKLKLEAHAGNGFPGVGRVEDLDGDGIGEVILDRTDAYVFCYACGVREASVDVLRWRGDRLASVTLGPLSGGASAADVQRALDAVSGGVWSAAMVAMDDAMKQDTGRLDATTEPGREMDEDLLTDDLLVIRANYAARAALASDDSAYPLLQRVFLGNWYEAVEPLRAHPPTALFAADSPLIVGTAAEGNVPPLAERIAASAGGALVYGAKQQATDASFNVFLAAVHFLRGWSAWLAAPGDAAARADIAKAAELAPDDSLYAASAEWVAAQP